MLYWGTQNIKVASALGALGFPIRTQVITDDRSGKRMTQFFLGHDSVWRKGLNVIKLVKQWHKGELVRNDPLHPFLCGLRAEHNFSAILDAQNRGRRIRLVGDGQKCASIYADGEELPSLVNAPATVQTSDLSLAAALGTIGIPVIQIEQGSHGHTYTLPDMGHWLMSAPAPDGEAVQYQASQMMRRAELGKLDLSLELDNPNHPLVAAYNARHVHNTLKRHLGETRGRIIIRPPGTQRSAVISENPAPHVLDAMQRHFRI